MWPWEHVAVAYLVYSLGARATGRSPPSAATAGVVAAFALVPDLVDKPLSWGLELFPSGYAVAHSAFVAFPAGAVAVVVARRFGRQELGVAAALGLWSHLAADVLAPVRSGGSPDVGRVLWPVVEGEPYAREYGLGRGLVYLRDLATDLQATAPGEAAVLYLLVPSLAVGVWLADGAPGAGWLGSLATALARRSPVTRR